MSPTALVPALPGELGHDDLFAPWAGGRAPVGEPQTLHDPTRSNVLGLEDADDALEAARREPELERGCTHLGGQAEPAPRTRHAPTHPDGGKDPGQEVRHRQPGPADHGAAGPVEQRLDPEAVALVARQD